MARRRSASGDVSLFPFLSILVCVIGLLTLMIAGAALTEIEQAPDMEAVARAQEFRRLKAALAEDERVVGRLQDRLASSELAEARLEAARNRLDDARADQRRLREEDQARARGADLQAQLAALQTRLESLTNEYGKRVELIAQLDDEIERKGRPPEAAVQIRPTGTGLDLDPVFIECTDAGVAILDREQPLRVRSADLKSDPNFLEILDRVADSDRAVVVFLLRNDGVEAYHAARAVADARGARNGKIPVIGHGRIDLSRIKTPRR
jgi:hypothetical protein